MELLTEKMKQFDRAQLRAAVFDLDGTLLDTVRDLGTAANVTLAHFGFPQHPLEAYQGFIGNGLLMLYRRAAPAGTDEATVEALRDYGRDYYREHCTCLTRVYDGAPELLHGLAARGIMLGMVTNKTEATARHVMAHYFPEVPFRFIWSTARTRCWRRRRNCRSCCWDKRKDRKPKGPLLIEGAFAGDRWSPLRTQAKYSGRSREAGDRWSPLQT